MMSAADYFGRTTILFILTYLLNRFSAMAVEVYIDLRDITKLTKTDFCVKMDIKVFACTIFQ